MAAVYKATKVSMQVSGGPPATPVVVTCNYTDPTTVPPTPGVVIAYMDTHDSEVAANIQTEIDAILSSLGTTTIDWTL